MIDENGRPVRSAGLVDSVPPDRRLDAGRGFEPLRGRGSFSWVYQEGRRSRRGDVTVIVAPGAPGAPQVGVVAGRGVGGAVRRNRAKRRLRHAMAAAPLVSSTAYIVIAGRRVPDVGYPTLAGWLAGAMGRTGGDDRGRMDREEETK